MFSPKCQVHTSIYFKLWPISLVLDVSWNETKTKENKNKNRKSIPKFNQYSNIVIRLSLAPISWSWINLLFDSFLKYPVFFYIYISGYTYTPERKFEAGKKAYKKNDVKDKSIEELWNKNFLWVGVLLSVLYSLGFKGG